jgi:Uma2 family endonuclease
MFLADRPVIAKPLPLNLPSTADLPCSDDTPVDNEDQNLLPNLLLLLLTSLWADRMDWYFGVDMAIYHTTGVSPRVPVVPEGFLSLGVERRKGGKSRRSYATWEEDDRVPIFVLEMVSHWPDGEYDESLALYANLGVLYYLIYNPEFWQRDRHQPFELYRLERGEYQLQIGEPYWMPEVGLGIGRYRGPIGGIHQEMLTWYDAQGQRYLSAEEARVAAEQRSVSAEVAKVIAEERADRLEALLRSQGIDPNQDL